MTQRFSIIALATWASPPRAEDFRACSFGDVVDHPRRGEIPGGRALLAGENVLAARPECTPPDVDAVFVDDRQAIRIRIRRESEVGFS
jgi:hypothetical protein